MRKSFANVVFFVLLLVFVSSIVGASEGDFRIFINDEPLIIANDMGTPFIDNQSRTQIPLRAISEGLGYEVKWKDATKTVTIVKSETEEIHISIDSDKVITPNDTIIMDTTAVIIGERTYVPLRFVSEALGYSVDYQWNGYHGIRIADFSAKPAFYRPDYQDLPGEITSWIELSKELPLVQEKEYNGKRFVLITEGMKLTGGYSVEVKEVVVHKESLIIKVKSIKPGADDFVTQAITYPYDLIVVENKELPLRIIDVDDEEITSPFVPEQGYVSEIDLSGLDLMAYNQDIQINPQRNLAAFSGFDFNTETFEQTSKIALVDLTMGTVESLIEGEHLKIINWSPDGSRILYFSMDGLMLYQLDTGTSENIGENAYYGAFSDDGSKLAYTKRNDGLYVYNISNGHREKISEENDANWPLWYSDNQTIFYFTDLGIVLGDGAGYKQGLAKINTVTKEKEIIIPQESGKYRKAFWMIPDKVLYVLAGWDDGIYDKIVDLEQGKVVEVGENDAMRQYALAVSPHGKLLKAEGNNLFFLDRKGSKAETIELNKLNDFVFDLAFSPEGKKLAFLDGELGINSYSKVKGRELKVLSLETNTFEVIGDFAYYNQPRWLDESHLVTVINAPVEDSPFMIKVFKLE